MDSRREVRIVMDSFQRNTTIESVKEKYGVKGQTLNKWRAEFKEKSASLFSDKRCPKNKAKSLGFKPGESPDDLKKIIGELTVQNEILKKVQELFN